MMTGRKLQAEELLEDLYCAYFDARKNKRGTASQLRFELNLERNLSVLEKYRALRGGTLGLLRR